MKIEKIYSGIWLPRTILHLKEFYRFLQFGETHLRLDKEVLKNLRKNLAIKEATFQRGALDFVSAKLDKLDFNYLEDGTVLLGKKVEDLDKDFKYITDFSLNKLLKAFSYIYSKGAPIPKVFSGLESIMPLILILSSGQEKEIKGLYEKFENKINQRIVGNGIEVYFGDKLVVLVGKKIDNIEVVRYLVFLQEYKNQLDKLLNIHRFTWDEISKIREKHKVRYKDLPIMRDLLLDLRKDISYFTARLSQMDAFAKERNRVVNDLLKRDVLKEYITNQLRSLFVTQNYLTDLWIMTKNYADSTFNLLGMLYQENEQREINTLQVIFIIGVIASLLTLGTISGASVKVFDPLNNVINTAEISSFETFGVLKFGGIALVLSATLYLILHYIFTSLKRFRVVDIGKFREKTIESIKKKLS